MLRDVAVDAKLRPQAAAGVERCWSPPVVLAVVRRLSSE
jgi:hypothetical protein